MTNHSTHTVLHKFRGFLVTSDLAGLSDAQLIEDYRSRNDQAAFAALVRRHGPMVLAVCRRVLHNPQDAEDAFQATFLVLVKKVGSIGRPEQLGNWLYGVAYRTALKARGLATRQRITGRELADLAQAEPIAEIVWQEIRVLLDEGLQK